MKVSLMNVKRQYELHKEEYDKVLLDTAASGLYIGGGVVREFENKFANYVESGRRTMTLGTYLRIVEALRTTPLALLKHGEQSEEWIDRLSFITANCSNREMKFVLYMVEQVLKGYENYLK